MTVLDATLYTNQLIYKKGYLPKLTEKVRLYSKMSTNFKIRADKLNMIEIENEFGEILGGQKFVDLFCGIGGFHLALHSFGAKCVFASDIDAEARKVYKDNFDIEPQGDICNIKADVIPAHDILCGGFPCEVQLRK